MLPKHTFLSRCLSCNAPFLVFLLGLPARVRWIECGLLVFSVDVLCSSVLSFFDPEFQRNEHLEKQKLLPHHPPADACVCLCVSVCACVCMFVCLCVYPRSAGVGLWIRSDPIRSVSSPALLAGRTDQTTDHPTHTLHLHIHNPYMDISRDRQNPNDGRVRTTPQYRSVPVVVYR